MADDTTLLGTVINAYIPILVFVALCFLGRTVKTENMFLVFKQGLFLYYTLAVVLGIMFVDNKLELWSVLGLDYSIHAAMGFMLSLWFILFVREFWFIWCSLLMGYFLAILLRGHYSLMDILTSSMAVSLFCLPIILRYISRLRKQS